MLLPPADGIGRFQSTHPARGATHAALRQAEEVGISIHAPREGCDCRHWRRTAIPANFNPRTPRGVRRLQTNIWTDKDGFQSTHPARGATLAPHTWRRSLRFQSTHPARGATRTMIGRPPTLSNYFNPRTPRGVRHGLPYNNPGNLGISIHAPREGCDRRQGVSYRHHRISIHAPREGCDCKGWIYPIPAREFQSTHPARGATSDIAYYVPHAVFQSTHPARGATCIPQFPPQMPSISIHAPREGCDRQL